MDVATGSPCVKPIEGTCCHIPRLGDLHGTSSEEEFYVCGIDVDAQYVGSLMK